MVDAEAAGWASAWLDNDGSLDVRGHGVLLRCISRLSQVIPSSVRLMILSDWAHLREMAQLVAASPQVRAT